MTGPVTLQLNVPSLGVLAVMGAHDVPPLRDTSIFTFPVRPAVVH